MYILTIKIEGREEVKYFSTIENAIKNCNNHSAFGWYRNNDGEREWFVDYVKEFTVEESQDYIRVFGKAFTGKELEEELSYAFNDDFCLTIEKCDFDPINGEFYELSLNSGWDRYVSSGETFCHSYGYFHSLEDIERYLNDMDDKATKDGMRKESLLASGNYWEASMIRVRPIYDRLWNKKDLGILTCDHWNYGMRKIMA